jgi:hypothetical protein
MFLHVNTNPARIVSFARAEVLHFEAKRIQHCRYK